MKKEIILLIIINTISSMGYSLIAPLFPPMASERHINAKICGIIIAIFACSNFILTLSCPYLISKVGRKRLFYFAIALEASCSILYGFLNCIKEYYTFIFFAALGRFFHGIGCGITAILVYSLTALLSDPDQAKVSLGYLELGWCVGLSIGPAFASFFYSFGGYMLPFIVLGMMFNISVFLAYHYQLPLDDIQDDPPNFLKHFLKFVKNNLLIIQKEIIIASCLPVLDIVSKTFFYPTFANHLINNFGMTVESASFFFVVNMASYFCFLQMLNPITKTLGLKLTMAVGLVAIFIGTLFLPPVEFLPQCATTIFVGLLILGISGACINVPFIIDTALILKNNDPTLDDITANDFTSTMFNLANFGEIIGPIFGGFITEHQGFEASCLWTGGICLGFAVFYFALYQGSIREYLIRGMSNETKERELHEKLVVTSGEECEAMKFCK